jgi:hypothetical protein
MFAAAAVSLKTLNEALSCHQKDQVRILSPQPLFGACFFLPLLPSTFKIVNKDCKTRWPMTSKPITEVRVLLLITQFPQRHTTLSMPALNTRNIRNPPFHTS